MEYGNNFFDLNNNSYKKVKNFKKTVSPPIMKILDFDEFNYFNSFENEFVYFALFLTLYWTGRRISETVTLKWENFSKTKHTLTFCSNLTKQRNDASGIVHIVETNAMKTGNAYKVLDLPDVLYQTLLKLKQQTDGPYIFGGDRWMHPNSNRRYRGTRS